MISVSEQTTRRLAWLGFGYVSVACVIVGGALLAFQRPLIGGMVALSGSIPLLLSQLVYRLATRRRVGAILSIADHAPRPFRPLSGHFEARIAHHPGWQPTPEDLGQGSGLLPISVLDGNGVEGMQVALAGGQRLKARLTSGLGGNRQHLPIAGQASLEPLTSEQSALKMTLVDDLGFAYRRKAMAEQYLGRFESVFNHVCVTLRHNPHVHDVEAGRAL